MVLLTLLLLLMNVATMSSSSLSCEDVTSNGHLVIPGGTESIESSALKNCSSLKTISIPSSVSSIGNDAFQGCSNLETVTIPDNVKSMGRQCFADCGKLVEVIFGTMNEPMPTQVLKVGREAFRDNISLKKVTIQSKSITFANGVFENCEKLKNTNQILWCMNTEVIAGMQGSYSEFHCNGRCRCNDGYGRAFIRGHLYVCTRCARGSWSSHSVDTCLFCDQGKYTEWSGSSDCTYCPAGTHGTIRGAVSQSEGCQDCSTGKYASAGSKSCQDCPPGNSCDAMGLGTYQPCEAGYYADNYGLTSCIPCPPGRYQSKVGMATCVLCPIGKSNPDSGASYAGSCTDCPAGRHAKSNGFSECEECAPGQIQPKTGMMNCSITCSEQNAFYTSNEDHTECIENEDLHSEKLIEAMFDDGTAFTLTSAIAFLFSVLGGFVQRKREGKKGELGQMSRHRSVIKAFISGLGFATEFFLLIGIWPEAPDLAGTILASRFIHIGGALVIVLAAYSENKGLLGNLDKFIPEASSLGELIDKDFSRKNNSTVCFVIFASLLDMSMLHYLPWKSSRFVRESHGLPTMGTLAFYLIMTTVQTLIAVPCEVSFLVDELRTTSNKPTVTSGFKIFMSINIVLSTWGMLMGIIQFFLKLKLLMSVDEEIERESKAQPMIEEGKNDEQRQPQCEHGLEDRQEQEQVEQEEEQNEEQDEEDSEEVGGLALHEIYKRNDGDGGDDGEVSVTSNPMHNVAHPSTTLLDEQINKLKEGKELKTETVKDLKVAYVIVKEEIKKLKLENESLKAATHGRDITGTGAVVGLPIRSVMLSRETVPSLPEASTDAKEIMQNEDKEG